MAPNQEDFGLQEAIRTTLVQLCKVGVIYQSELTVIGTVGVTVDRKRTVLVHFDERIGPCSPDTSSSIGVKGQPPDVNSLHFHQGTLPSTPNLGNAVNINNNNLPLQWSNMNMTYSDLGVFNAVATSTKNEAYSQTLQTSIPIPIDIDSDSESMCDLQFDDDVIEVDPPTMIRKQEVMWSGEDENCDKNESKAIEVKNNNSPDTNESALASRLDSTFSTPTSSVSSSLSNEESVETSSQTSQTNVCDQSNIVMTPPSTRPTAPIRLVVDKALFLQKAAGKTNTNFPPPEFQQNPDSPKLRMTRSKTKRKLSQTDDVNSSVPNPAQKVDESILEYERASHLAREKKMTKLMTSGNVGGRKDNIKHKCCEVCERDFPTQGLLEAHLVEAHGVVKSVEIGEIVHHQCKHCNKKFRYQATLDKHEFLHVAEKPYKCEVCSNSYCYFESLQIHMNIHAGVLDCMICGKMYSSRKHLQKHIVYMHEMRRVRNGTTPKKKRITMEAENDEDE